MAFRSSLGKYSKGFSPPLAMQEAVWSSILNGDFIDAKIFAFSQRSHIPGRVNTPKPLFVNTHVLATACSYFESTFSFSDGIETDINAGLPPNVEPFFDIEEGGFDNDFDDPVEDEPARPRPQVSPVIPKLPQKTIKTYVVKYTAYRTLRAIVWYIYTGEISFSSDSSQVFSAPAKSVYRFADEHSMEQLKSLAAGSIKSSIDQLSPSELVEEACSVLCNAFTSRYPEWNPTYAERLSLVVSTDWEAKWVFQSKLSAYFSGELPHCRDIITSAFLRLLNNPADRGGHHPSPEDHSTISRVSDPWPDWTRDALSLSLDSGVFDRFKFSIFDAQETKQLVYLPTMLMDDESKGSLALRARGFSIQTWQALVYYKYTGCITFTPLGPRRSGGVLAVRNPSDPRFRGYPCPMKEMYNLALQLGYFEMTKLVTTEMASSLTPENAVEEMFSGSPLPADAIRRGLELMRRSGRDGELCVPCKLREVLEEAADGSRSQDFGAFSACFNELTPGACLDWSDD